MTVFPDWFQYAQRNFHEVLPIPEWKDRPVTLLQVGAYTGDASLWLHDHVLTDPRSRLHDVDTWEGSDGEPEHERLNWESVHSLYLQRIRNRPQIIPHRTTSDQFFATHGRRTYDFIYIDGAHTKDQVARDAEHAHMTLADGGIIAFDDYIWWGGVEGDRPCDAIRPFVAEHAGDYKVIIDNSQLWLRRL